MSEIFIFDSFKLIPGRWEFYRDDELIKLEPKVFDTLVLLVKHAGQPVSKDELLQHVWPDAVANESSLSRNISVLRAVLGSDASDVYIKTVRNGGYCFYATVQASYEPDSEILKESATPAISKIEPAKRPYRLYWWMLGVATLLLGGIILFVVLSAKKAPVFSLKRITSNATELPILIGAISPDGFKIAFAEGSQLFVSDIKAAERHLITIPPGFIPAKIDWFPDGLNLLVSANNNDTHMSRVWKISTIDGKQELVFNDAQLATVSPDGNHIAFLRKQSDEWWITSQTGADQRLAYSVPRKGELTGNAQFSANSRYLLLMHMRNDSGGHPHATFKAYDLSDGKIKTVFETGHAAAGFLLLANDDLLISEYAGAPVGSMQLLITHINMDTGAYNEPHLVTRFPGESIDDFNATSDGKKILLVKNRRQSDIYAGELSKDGTSISRPHRVTLNDGNEWPAQWIDNNTLLMASDRTGAFKIYAQSLYSNDAKLLAEDGLEDIRPTLTADGKHLFFMSKERHPAPTRLSHKSLTDGAQNVAYTSNDFLLLLHCASNSSMCVLAEHDDQSCHFYKYDPIKGVQRELLNVNWNRIFSLNVYHWDLSHDGKRIAMLDIIDGQYVISVFELWASPARRTNILFQAPSTPRTVMWDANSGGFFVSTHTDDDEHFSLLHVAPDGTTVSMHTAPFGEKGWAIASPDGRNLAYQKYTDTSNLWLMELH